MAPWEEATRRCLAVIPFSVIVSLIEATSLTGKMYACRSTNGTTGFSMEENIVELPWVFPSYSSRLTSSVLRAFSLKKV